MKKKFPIALATSLLLANGASVAMAAKVSEDGTTTSTTVPVTRGKSKSTGTQNQRPTQGSTQNDAREAAAKYRQEQVAFRAELTKYLTAKKAILVTFRSAMADANKAFKDASKSATNQEDRKAAIKTRNDAFKAAVEAKNADLMALGDPPEKPVKAG